MKITIKDVAELAGVSPSTVSRVLHDSPKISEKTKEIVNDAMHRLQYQPNVIASGLAGRSTKTLGLLLPNSPEELFINPFFIKAMKGLSIYAQEQGYKLMYSFSQDEEQEVQFIKSYLHSSWVEGIILFTSRQNDQCIAYLKERNFPFVVIGRPESTPDLHWVDNDNFQAMYNVVNYLVMGGAKNIAFIGGPIDFDVTRYRLDGYKQALINRGLEINPGFIRCGNSFNEESGYLCMREILHSEIRPDALVTTDDLLAFGARKAIEEKLGSESSISLVGFNNSIRGAYESPTLTTVDINPEQLGIKAATLLIDILQNKSLITNHFIVETQLIERDSTANLGNI
jgi:DNA-binding LacI/PurR family transcriptional regulator